MKPYLTLVLLFVISTTTFGQASNFTFTTNITDSSANFHDIVQQANDFYNINPDSSEGGGYAAFKRWEWFWGSRVNKSNKPSGSFQYAQQALSTLLNEQICTGNSSYPSWQSLGPKKTMSMNAPNSFLGNTNIGRIKAIAVDPNNHNIIYAGGESGGVFKTNNGLSPTPIWTNITNHTRLPGLGINDIKIDPTNSQVVWVATGNAQSGGYGIGILKSTDGGLTWDSKTPLSPSLGQTVRKIEINYLNPNIVYALIDDKLYKTLDGGNSWSNPFTLPNSIGSVSFNPFIRARDLFDIALHPTNPEVVYIASHNHEGSLTGYYSNSQMQFGLNNGLYMYKSTDGFNTYSLMNMAGTPTSEVPGIRLSLAVTPAEPNSVFAVFESSPYSFYATNRIAHLYKSSDMGNTWNLISNPNIGSGGGYHYNDLAVSPTDANIIYTIGLFYPYKSTDGGLSFTPQDNDLHVDCRTLEIFGGSPVGTQGVNDFVIYGNDGGIAITTQGGNPWYDANGLGLNVSQYYGVGSADKEYKVAGGTQDNTVSFYEGISNEWVLPQLFQDGGDVLFDKNNPNIAYSQTWCCDPETEYIYKYEYNGSIWNRGVQFKPSGGGPSVRSMVMDNNNNLYVGYQNIHKKNTSTIGVNSNWTAISDFSNNFSGTWGYIKAVEVCNSNPNVIYAAFSRTCNGCPNYAQQGLLFKTTSGGGVNPNDWINITGNLPAVIPQWLPITDIVTDPEDTRNVWITIGGFDENTAIPSIYNGVNRVLHSIDGGNTWVDYSDGLTQFPVNDIKYHEGSDGGLYIATDVGVFYRNASMSQWECFAKDMPVSVVTDLSISTCQGKIWASTYGQGMWEADLISDDNSLKIITNTTWGNDRDVKSNITITTGNTLTINNSAVINMAKEKNIIIQKGGKLVVDGGTITNQCGHLWGSIEVQGDANASQLTPNAQGQLILQNGAVIENAKEGAHTSKHDANNNPINGTFGGIIKMDNSTIKNCKTGINFGPYQNCIPNNPSIKLNDLSYIRNSNFIWDDTGNLDDLNIVPYSHVGLWRTNGVDLVANEFRNDFADSDPYYQEGIGVITIDANCKIVNGCSSLSAPCPTANKTPNVFKNLKTGVQSLGISTIARVNIDGNLFDNNKTGVKLEATQYTSVIRNEFLVPISNISPQSGGDVFGIYSTFSYGYNFEENTFTSTGPEPVNGSNYGIVSDNSLATGGGLIYKNSYSNMVVANLSSQDNSMLKMDCNNYAAGTLRQYDWAVTSGVLANQGNCNTTPAKNNFDLNCSNQENIFVANNAQSGFIYFAFNGDQPNCASPVVLQNDCAPGSPQNTCPSNFSNPLNPTFLLAQMNNLKTEINDNLLAQIDGGNTAYLLSVIDNEPDWKIRNELSAASPLSEEVLLALINANVANWVYQQVLADNTPLSDAVFIATINKTPALPDYIVKDIVLASSPLHTQEQLAIINHSPKYPDWVLQDIMVQNSPLKDEVLLALMEITPYVANSTMKTIMLQNTPLSNEVSDAFNNHVPNYPNWVLNVVNNSTFVADEAIDEPQPSSALSDIMEQVTQLKLERLGIKNQFIRMCLDSHQYQDVEDVLIADKTLADKMSLFLLNVESNTPYANQMITELLTDASTIEATDSTNEDVEMIKKLCELYTHIQNDVSNTGSFNGLDSTNQASVSAIAASSAASAIIAQNILNVFNNQVEERFAEPIINNASSSRLTTPKTKNHTLNTNHYALTNYPNPFSNSTIIQVNLPEAITGEIIITDITGKILKRFNLTETQHKLEISGNDIGLGIFFYSLYVNDRHIETKKMTRIY